jgi:hypothetical protein
MVPFTFSVGLVGSYGLLADWWAGLESGLYIIHGTKLPSVKTTLFSLCVHVGFVLVELIRYS